MANLKLIRKRIASVKSTQKITRAMKMVAGARLNRAQQRILAIRPYAVRTGEALAAVVEAEAKLASDGARADHPLLVRREEKSALYLVITSDRGLCGAFNSNINRMAERLWKERERAGQTVKIAVVGRKGRDYFKRRGAPVFHVFGGVWDKLDLEQSRAVARTVLRPYIAGEVDSIYIVYNEFKSAMSQRVVAEKLFPVEQNSAATEEQAGEPKAEPQFIFEPSKEALLEQLVPMYVEISILRALYESMASELGARMTAMDSATKNASEMIGKLTLQYNRARQAAITTELMEIIGGAEALKD
ncbi:MAG TPA: ATP synthase F1 subunit gamma [Polyangiaceae bacterium]